MGLVLKEYDIGPGIFSVSTNSTITLSDGGESERFAFYVRGKRENEREREREIEREREKVRGGVG